VSEALWKDTTVVAGRAGGIPLQVQDGVGGFVVDSVEECAARTLWLLQHPVESKTLALAGRERVRERFLLTRLIADELRLYGALLRTLPATAAAVTGRDEPAVVRDLVCGMSLDPHKAVEFAHQGRRYYFCSRACATLFQAVPERYLRAAGGHAPEATCSTT
jgi:trehalose synthase